MTETNSSESVTLRMPGDVLRDIEIIAKATDRSRSYIIVRALRTYLLNEGADVMNALRGKQQIADGEYEDIDDIIADMDRVIATR